MDEAPRRASAQVLEAMSRWRGLVGRWAGVAHTMRYDGRGMIDLWQTENVESRCDGAVITVEGRGFESERAAARGADPVFSAFAVFTFDEAADEHRLRAYNAGRELSVALELVDSGFRWTIPGTPRLAYASQIEGDVWHETGLLIGEGMPTEPFHEMRLARVR